MILGEVVHHKFDHIFRSLGMRPKDLHVIYDGFTEAKIFLDNRAFHDYKIYVFCEYDHEVFAKWPLRFRKYGYVGNWMQYSRPISRYRIPGNYKSGSENAIFADFFQVREFVSILVSDKPVGGLMLPAS